MTYSLRIVWSNRQKTDLYLKLKAEPIDGRLFLCETEAGHSDVCRFLADHDQLKTGRRVNTRVAFALPRFHVKTIARQSAQLLA